MNRLASALTVLAILAGPPLAATVWLRRHPWQPPTRTDIQRWAGQPMTTGTILAWIIVLTFCCWLLLVWHLTHRALTGLRRRWQRLRHLPLPSAAQVTASSMAGVAAFTLPAIPTGHPAPVGPAVTGSPHLPDSSHLGHDVQARTPGITLPGGGWIPCRTAIAVGALSALTWIERRRHYRPDPTHPRDHHDDPDLQPLPATVHTITTALADSPPGDSGTPEHLPPDRLPPGILRLTGPGAAAAARGLLVTAALSAATGSTTARVLLHPDDLHRLLPGTDSADLPTAGPADPPTPDPDHHEPGDLGEHRHDPDEHATVGWSSGAGTATLIVLVEDPTATHRWHVAIDGTATGTGLARPRRLCTLDAQAATDLLTLTRPRHDPGPVTAAQSAPRVEATTALSEPAVVAAAQLTLLGDCRLTVAGNPVALSRTAGLQVLAYLAVHAGGVTRSDLTRAVWPHLPPAATRQRLHTTLTDLRKQLRPLLTDEPVTRRDDRYQLNTRAITTDLQPVHAGIQTVTHAVGTPAQLQACRGLVDMYPGELAAGENWPWLTPAREQIRRSVIDACSTLAYHADATEALTWLQRAITLDPYDEPLHQQAADLLHAAGDHTGAADLIKRLHQRLDSSGPQRPG